MRTATQNHKDLKLNASLPSVCVSSQVPVVKRTVASIGVTIQGESASLSKKTKISIEPPAFIHIIQTDKPIYKPGQTGERLVPEPLRLRSHTFRPETPA